VSDVQIVTGIIKTVRGTLAVVTPDGTGDDGAPWPDVQDCRLLTLTGSGGSAALSMMPLAGDACLLLFVGEDKTSPYCLPCSVSAPQTVQLRHAGSHVTVHQSSIEVYTGGSARVEASSATIKAASISLQGNVTVTGSLSVAGAMTNGGKNIGAGHRHSNGTAQDGNTGAVI
jgi:hypothetical protein